MCSFCRKQLIRMQKSNEELNQLLETQHWVEKRLTHRHPAAHCIWQHTHWQSDGGLPPFHHDQRLIPGKASCGKNIIDGYQNRRILLNVELAVIWLEILFMVGKKWEFLSYLQLKLTKPPVPSTSKCPAQFWVRSSNQNFFRDFPRNAAPKILNSFCITADFVFLWFVCFANFDADETHDWWWTHLKNKNRFPL